MIKKLAQKLKEERLNKKKIVELKKGEAEFKKEYPELYNVVSRYIKSDIGGSYKGKDVYNMSKDELVSNIQDALRGY